MKKKQDVQIKLFDVDQIGYHVHTPITWFSISKERYEFHKNQIKNDSPASAIKVYRRPGEKGVIAIEQIEKLQVAFTEFVPKLYVQILDITDKEASLLMPRLADTADDWSLTVKSIYFKRWLNDKGEDIEGAMAEYAEICSCTRTAVTHMHHIGIVALYLKDMKYDKFDLLKDRGTHLRYIYVVDQTQWIDLCNKMLAGDWSAERVKETVKKLILHKPIAESSPEEESAYTPEPEPDKPQPSQLDILSDLHTDIDKIQLSLVQVSDVLRHDWTITSPEDQESAQAIAKEIHDIVTSILNYFPLSWLVANTEAADATGAVQIPLI